MKQDTFHCGKEISSHTSISLVIPQTKLTQSCRMMQTKGCLSVRELAKLIRMLSATRHAVLPAPLYFRQLQCLAIQSLRRLTSFDALVTRETDAVDLFASRLNNQLPQYVSWRPDPFSLGTDAFQLTWLGLQGYAFLPFSLISRCVQKIWQERSTVVLITPLWQAQAWFSALLELAVEKPLLLPMRPDILVDPLNQLHPLVSQGKLQLVAWKVSGENTLQLEFHGRLQTCCWQAGAKEPTRHMNQAGSVGFAGVLQGKWIPFQVGSTPS